MRVKRSVMAVGLLLGLVVVPVLAGATDLTGTWTLTSTTPRGERTSTLVLVQSGEKLTVTLKGERGESTGAGTLKGDAVEWTVVRPTPMGELTMTYTGKVAGETMTGEVQTLDRTVPWKAVRESTAPDPAARTAAPEAAPAVTPAPPSAPPPPAREAFSEAPAEAPSPVGKPPATLAPPKAGSTTLLTVDKVEQPSEKVRVGLESITGRELTARLAFLASDALEGRETGTTGHRVAAEYAAMMMSLWGLTPAGDSPRPRPRSRMPMGPPPVDEPVTRSFLQAVELKEILESSGSAKVEWRDSGLGRIRWFEKDVDFQMGEYYAGLSDSQQISAPVVFVGYGISEKQLGYDDYAGIDVKGKIVMMLSGLPPAAPGSPLTGEEIRRKYDPPAFGRRFRFGPSARDLAARQAGAVAVLLVESAPEKNGDVARRVVDASAINDEQPIIPGGRRRLTLPDASAQRQFEALPTVRVSRQMADHILMLVGANVEALQQRLASDQRPHSMLLRGLTFTLESKVTTRLLSSVNVLGYVEGSDPALKDEVVVVGAHLDHLGRRGDYIFNGADDNGSGSVAVLEIAQAFATNPTKPRRKVLFALWTGEEQGLLGSRHYVLYPPFPIAKTVATINLDMVSRSWNKEQLGRLARMFGEEISDEDLATVDVNNLANLSFKDATGALRRAVADANRHVGLTVLVREAENDGIGAGGSDHAPFALKGVSWGFFNAAMTADYHQPSDTVEKTSAALMEKVARLTFLTAFALADGG
ncbi:MAG: M28 family peptidase [Thermoanaerobaculaceae bacterium]|nr:M28 family peptidase [Thermoanaerobaculaceae bacterium]MDI9621383.1 M28 family peptidase [Acidobacteriota bacterium]NLH09785.1 M28 family peptidase [Holophagae bacterium]HPW56917.1 M28 family peptidase [Thermoanaerobaculaceae bacterium]